MKKLLTKDDLIMLGVNADSVNFYSENGQDLYYKRDDEIYELSNNGEIIGNWNIADFIKYFNELYDLGGN